MKTKTYNISGMSCAACSSSVQRVVSRLDGVKSCEVNLITGKMTVVFNEKKTGEADFIRVVTKAGFGIESEKANTPKTDKKSEFLPIAVSSVFCIVLLYISMGQMLIPNIPIPDIINLDKNPYNFAITQLILCLPPLILGKNFFTKGLSLLFRGHPNMDSLVAVGAGASLIYSIVMTYAISFNPHAVHNLYFESVAVVITLVKLGKYFESRSKKKTASAIKKLMELAPDTSLVFVDGKEVSLPTSEVKVGDILIAKAGDKISLDGIITDGKTSVDESMLTGESMPVSKTLGDSVTGGSLNLNGVIYYKVTRIGTDTTLSKIIKFVEEAQSKKAPISKTADKVAGIFTPVVIAIALITAAIWLIVGKDISFALKTFTSVLVIACPCALGLATPTSIMVGTGLGASNGILIRNGEVLETVHNVKAVVFDKTGTITKGKPTVSDVLPDSKVISFAASAESGSNHPLAKAVIEYANQNNIPFSKAYDIEDIAGNGIRCKVEEKTVLVGKKAFLEENKIDISGYEKQSQELSKQGKSLIFVALEKECIGLIAVADEVKPTAKKAFERLEKMRIKRVILSGDNKLCAEHIGEILGADKVYSEITPENKAMIIEEISKKYGTVMMVGDGINDAPALTKADIGCAIGSGSDIAIESADIVLMKSDPQDVCKAIHLSKITIKNIKQNLFWAFCYNSVCIPIAAGLLYAFGGPLLNPMFAGLAMSFSSVFVVGNALRLRYKKI